MSRLLLYQNIPNFASAPYMYEQDLALNNLQGLICRKNNHKFRLIISPTESSEFECLYVL